MRKNCDFDNPKHELTVEGIVWSCFYNLDRKRFPKVKDVTIGEYSLCQDDDFSPEEIIEYFEKEECTKKFDA